MYFLGIDLGTSAVKVLLVDADQRAVDHESAALQVQRPRATWSEQDPESWWQATDTAVQALRSRCGPLFGDVAALGLSGQMHGATLLDGGGSVLRPAILWNDGRSEQQCADLERREPNSREITGNLAMSGFTAPKLIWVEENEPEVFARVQRVLLPKDYLRWKLSGEYVSEMSDAAGTLWLDVANRRWSEAMLAATHLDVDAMPRLCEGNEVSATLQRSVAQRWGIRPGIPIAGGGGDNAASAVGLGVVSPGQAFLSLGTSGVLFVVNESFTPNPDRAAHAFCHALPERWHQMAVILSAASCVSWASAAFGATSERALLDEIDLDRSRSVPIFLPYLSGERTPHNDAHAKGVFAGVTHETTRGDLARAVLEGVAFALSDGLTTLVESGAQVGGIAVGGGGSRSRVWGSINIEVNHATLAGHSFHHEIAYAIANGIFGSVDANRGDPQNGWDTDQFPISVEEMALPIYEIAKSGGIGTGGFNFDANCSACPVFNRLLRLRGLGIHGSAVFIRWLG